MSELLGRRSDLFKGVVKLAEWSDLICDRELDDALSAVDATGDTITPPAELIFEALRYGGPDDCVAVILGQDPYPSAGDARGLCFSAPRGTVPESLVRIFGALSHSGLRIAERGTSGDLRSWAAQGVLMLNAALTTRVGKSNAHAAYWKPFVTGFVSRLCARRAARPHLPPIHFLLWGGAARAFAPLAAAHGQPVLEWTHPSPLADNRLPEAARFRVCPHFAAVNEVLRAASRRPIVWDNLAPVVAFSDGACSLNGRPGARAAFAAVLLGGQFGRCIVRGSVQPFEYAFVDDSLPELGVVGLGRPIAPSNNRAELLGLVYCFLALIRGRALGHVEVISDSLVSVRTLLEWLPARQAKGTAAELENFDLVMIAWRLLTVLRAQATAVELVHVRSHQKAPPADAPARVRLRWSGNDLADREAGAVLERASAVRILETVGSPPSVSALTL